VVTGEINADRDVVFSLKIQDKHGDTHGIPVVLDTGFNRNLTLPPFLIQALGLSLHGQVPVILGDGSTQNLALYDAVVFWDDTERHIKIHAADGVPLIGAALVYGYALYLHMVDGGPAVAVRLP
jgi:predicted aspartyl protease